MVAANGEPERNVYFTLPFGSAEVLRSIRGCEKFDDSKRCLKCCKPGIGTNHAPRAFSLKLRKTTRSFGLKATSYDQELETKNNLKTAKHVDDINMTGTEASIDTYAKVVESVLGAYKSNKHGFTNFGIRHRKLNNGDVTFTHPQTNHVA